MAWRGWRQGGHRAAMAPPTGRETVTVLSRHLSGARSIRGAGLRFTQPPGSDCGLVNVLLPRASRSRSWVCGHRGEMSLARDSTSPPGFVRGDPLLEEAFGLAREAHHGPRRKGDTDIGH